MYIRNNSCVPCIGTSCKFPLFSSNIRYADDVDMSKKVGITNKAGIERLSTGATFSPFPVTRAAREPERKKGTSLPTCKATSFNSCSETERPESMACNRANSAAASLEPPPSPAFTGICLSHLMSNCKGYPPASCQSRAVLVRVSSEPLQTASNPCTWTANVLDFFHTNETVSLKPTNANRDWMG